MDFRNAWLTACFSPETPARLAMVQRGPGDYIGPYSLRVAWEVSADLGGAIVVDAETGEILKEMEV